MKGHVCFFVLDRDDSGGKSDNRDKAELFGEGFISQQRSSKHPKVSICQTRCKINESENPPHTSLPFHTLLNAS